jgi:hypothetical protein
LVEDITNQPEFEREEEDTDPVEASPSTVGQKKKVQDAMEITLPYLPYAVITMDDMLGMVPKLRYVDHDVHDTDKFLELVEDSYLINTEEIGPLGESILEPMQWITRLYNSIIMNLLDITHFGRSKNVGLCVKQLLDKVHGGIMWMDRMVPIDVALIAKITRFPTIGAQPNEYLENKAQEKESVDIMKAQFGINTGNQGIVIKDINDSATRFSSKLMV